MFSPLFSRPSARLANQADFWIGECEQYLNGGEVSLSVIEGLLSEVKSLSRQFESLNPDKVRVEEQVELSDKYQSVRRLQLRLITLIGKLKDRHQARQSIKVIMPSFTGRASEYNLFKKEFTSWSQYLTETERRVSFLKAIENTEIKNKISSAATYKEMIRALDSFFGNSQVIISKLFADLQKLSKPSFLDYKTENKTLKDPVLPVFSGICRKE